jgi:hypothetical protein
MSEWARFESMRKVKGKTDFCQVWNFQNIDRFADGT